MKKLFLVAGLLSGLLGSAQHVISHDAAVPKELITNDSTWWLVSTLSKVGYVNTTAGPYYNTYKSGGGMMVKFKFLADGHFRFLLYVQANTYGTDTETWTEVEGKVTFTRDGKNQPVFITHAEKGVYRVAKNGITKTRPIPEAELKAQHSCTYLWEQFDFPDDPKNSYLLVVDMKKHPGADTNKPGSIDPSWVSKFHIPKR